MSHSWEQWRDCNHTLHALKRILFLDFDGVLHPASAYQTTPFIHAQALADCLQPHDCEIVISSSWRFQYTLLELRELLPHELARRVSGVTGPVHIGSMARYQEIQNHLLRRTDRDDVSWRALDDSSWEFPARQPELILCNPNQGIGSNQLRELSQWLE